MLRVSNFGVNQIGWVVVAAVLSLCGVDAGSAVAATGGTAGELAVKKPGDKELPNHGKEAPKPELKNDPAKPEMKKEAAKPEPKKEAAKYEPKKEVTKPESKKEGAKPEPPKEPAKPEQKPTELVPDPENEEEEAKVAVAKPVTGDPVQVYGWREMVLLEGIKDPLMAKLDTGALTSSLHAEEKEMFERDGKKWVRFIMTDPTAEKPLRRQIEAPLVRIAKIKEPGGESVAREVVRMSFQIGGRKMRGDFSLNNRSNMLAPVLLGRSIIKDLGWVDASRTNLADEKIFR